MPTRQSALPIVNPVENGSGPRKTRQRLALARIIFGNGHRHWCAEDLHVEAIERGISVSLATVYNTLRASADAGKLRQLEVDGRSYYDTNLSDHFHYFDVDEHRLRDMAPSCRGLGNFIKPPDGYEVIGVDVIAKLRRIRR